MAGPRDTPRQYRMCVNYAHEHVCNWMIPAASDALFCCACALNEIIPDLSQPAHRHYWAKIEAAKRRMLVTLNQLGLPVIRKTADQPQGLVFKFLADTTARSEFTHPILGEERVRTGHAQGVITINLAEADDVARTRQREQLGETYRTLLGHFRHESGHSYWDVLIRDTQHLDALRHLFGDDRQDYQQSLEAYYTNGPPPQWHASYLSAYCTAHPWEDWAETWAHYLHLVDSLETAREYRVVIDNHPLAGEQEGVENFERRVDDWMRLSIALNALNRSMGIEDAYPFVLQVPVRRKLAFVHQTIFSGLGQPA